MLVITKYLDEIKNIPGKSEAEVCRILYADQGLAVQLTAWDELLKQHAKWAAHEGPDYIQNGIGILHAEDELFTDDFYSIWNDLNTACLNPWFRKHTLKYDNLWRYAPIVMSHCDDFRLHADQIAEMRADSVVYPYLYKDYVDDFYSSWKKHLKYVKTGIVK